MLDQEGLSHLMTRTLCSASRERAVVDAGFGKGSVIAIFAANLAEVIFAFHAACMLGGAVTFCSPLLSDEELSAQLRDSAKVIWQSHRLSAG